MTESTRSAFGILGLEPRFDLDPSVIERAALGKLSAAHPDLVADAGDQAADVNEARDKLLDPESRANHLLELLGGPTSAQDKSLPDGFLQLMMMERMEIDGDIAANGEPARERWYAQAQARRDAIVERVSAMFACEDTSDGALRGIRLALNEWRYLERLVEQLGEPGSASSGLRAQGDL